MKRLIGVLTLALSTFTIASAETPEDRELFKSMVLIPAGEFEVGFEPGTQLPSFMSDATSSQNAQPKHKMNLDSYYLDRYEVTYGEFIKFKPAAKYSEGRVNHPMRGVSWYEAEAYCFWVEKRLPTEFEWEKAAKGKEGRLFVWGNTFDRKKANYGKSVKQIGSFPDDLSTYGAFDMNGNVSEWTSSDYLPYPKATLKDPNFGKGLKVIRGGAYNKREHGFLEIFATLSFRNPAPPKIRSWDTGFRCAKSVEN